MWGELFIYVLGGDLLTSSNGRSEPCRGIGQVVHAFRTRPKVLDSFSFTIDGCRHRMYTMHTRLF
jgi:hypothetical protein